MALITAPALPDDFDGYEVGNIYLPFGAGLQSAGAAMAANSIRMFYGAIRRRVTIDQLLVRPTAAGGVNGALGVYRSNGKGKPTGLPIAKTASFSVAASQVYAQAPDAGSVVLEPGGYWWAAWFDTSTTCVSLGATSAPAAYFGSATATDVLSATPMVTRAYALAFGAWPDLTGQTTNVSTTVGAAVGFRVA